MAFQQGLRITKAFILDRVREEDIFEKYFGPVVFEQNVINYARDDDSPGCRFYIHKTTGRIRFKDFGRGYNWDCFEAAQNNGITRSLDFIPLLKKIAHDFNLLKRKATKEELLEVKRSYEIRREIANNVIKKKIIITDATKKMNWNQRKFWDRFEVIQTDLEPFYVYNYRDAYVRYWYADGTTSNTSIYTDRHEIKFAYYLGEGEFKLYFPNRSKAEAKFMQTRADLIQGWHQLPDIGELVIITKSFKDVIVLRTMGFYAIAPSSESVLLPKEIMQKLFNRFERVYILFDNDFAGMRATVKYLLAYEELIPILYAKGQPKDTADNVEEFGREVVKENLLPLLQ